MLTPQQDQAIRNFSKSEGEYNDNVGQDLNTTGPNFQRAYRGGGL